MRCCNGVKILGLLVLAAGVVVAVGAAEARETIKMKIIAQNPSLDEPKTMPLKIEIPPEVMSRQSIMEHIPAGLELKYDSKTSTYYLEAEEITLAPAETRIFIIELEDVWYIEPVKLGILRKRAERAMHRLAGGEYQGPGEVLTKEIKYRLAKIEEFQEDDTVTRRDYIVGSRYNKDRLTQIRGDIETLESYVDASGAPPTPDLVKANEVLLDVPSRTATWLVIFIILTFLGILSGAFYFVWHRRARSDQSLAEAQGSAFDESERGKEG